MMGFLPLTAGLLLLLASPGLCAGGQGLNGARRSGGSLTGVQGLPGGALQTAPEAYPVGEMTQRTLPLSIEPGSPAAGEQASPLTTPAPLPLAEQRLEPLGQPLKEPSAVAPELAAERPGAAAREKSSPAQSAPEERPDQSAQGSLESLEAQARRDPAAIPSFFQASRSDRGEAAPLAALTGERGTQALASLRSRAEAALDRADSSSQRPPDSPDDREQRIDRWILGAQALLPEGVVSWLLGRPTGSGYDPRAGAELDSETFQVALAAANAALEGEGRPRLSLRNLRVLRDAEPDAPLSPASLELPDLRELGAYHGGVYAGMAELATPRQLVAAFLHEHLEIHGMTHEGAVAAVERLTRAAFGRAVTQGELVALAARGARGLPEPDRGGLVALRARADAKAAAPAARPATYLLLGTALAAGTAVAAFLDGGLSFMTIGFLVAAGLLALVGAWIAATRGLAAASALDSFRRFEGNRLPFDPATLAVHAADWEDSEGPGWIEISFEDARGRRVALHSAPAEQFGGTRKLELRWMNGNGTDESLSEGLHILSANQLKKADRPRPSAGAVAFRAQLLAHFRRAVREYPAEDARSREGLDGILRTIELTLDQLSYDDGERQHGRWML